MIVTAKKCSKCGTDKPLEDYAAESKAPDGRRSSCKVCERHRHKTYWNGLSPDSPSKQRKYNVRQRTCTIIGNARNRSRKRNLIFDLDDHVDKIVERLAAGRCELTGIALNLRDGRTFDSPSIDRIDPSKGYIYSNIRVICHAMNCALNNWGEESLLLVVRGWLKERSEV